MEQAYADCEQINHEKSGTKMTPQRWHVIAWRVSIITFHCRGEKKCFLNALARAYANTIVVEPKQSTISKSSTLGHICRP